MTNKINNAVCNNISANAKTATVQFAVMADEKIAKEQNQRLATTLVNINFSDINEAKSYIPGKLYNISIEESPKPYVKK